MKEWRFKFFFKPRFSLILALNQSLVVRKAQITHQKLRFIYKKLPKTRKDVNFNVNFSFSILELVAKGLFVGHKWSWLKASIVADSAINNCVIMRWACDPMPKEKAEDADVVLRGAQQILHGLLTVICLDMAHNSHIYNRRCGHKCAEGASGGSVLQIDQHPQPLKRQQAPLTMDRIIVLEPSMGGQRRHLPQHLLIFWRATLFLEHWNVPTTITTICRKMLQALSSQPTPFSDLFLSPPIQSL